MKRLIILLLTLIIQIKSLELNEPCDNRGKLGICKKSRQCPSAEYDYNYNALDFIRCGGYIGDHLIVCCIIDETTTLQPPIDPKLSVSERKCSEYSKSVYHEMVINTLAVGGTNTYKVIDTCFNREAVELISHGTNAKPREFPHMAALGLKNDSSVKWKCGGSLISDQFVLTAAHCITSGINIIRLGNIHLLKKSDDQYADNFEISENIVHPEYSRISHYNDIALIKLNRLVKFNVNIRPVCLPVKSDLIQNKLVATGWGRTSYFHRNSKKLLKVQLDYFTKEECAPIYKNKAYLKIRATQLCYGSRIGSQDACNGDSGGPLQLFNENVCLYKVFGITSLGLGCGHQNVPSIYTNVVPYIQWIEGIVWSDG